MQRQAPSTQTGPRTAEFQQTQDPDRVATRSSGDTTPRTNHPVQRDGRNSTRPVHRQNRGSTSCNAERERRFSCTLSSVCLVTAARGRLQLDSAHGHHTRSAVVWARLASPANHRPHPSGAGTCGVIWQRKTWTLSTTLPGHEISWVRGCLPEAMDGHGGHPAVLERLSRMVSLIQQGFVRQLHIVRCHASVTRHAQKILDKILAA